MSKYDQLIKDLRDPHCGDGTTTHINMRKEAADAIEALLAANIRPVVSGEWIDSCGLAECSICKTEFMYK